MNRNDVERSFKKVCLERDQLREEVSSLIKIANGVTDRDSNSLLERLEKMSKRCQAHHVRIDKLQESLSKAQRDLDRKERRISQLKEELTQSKNTIRVNEVCLNEFQERLAVRDSKIEKDKNTIQVLSRERNDAMMSSRSKASGSGSTYEDWFNSSVL